MFIDEGGGHLEVDSQSVRICLSKSKRKFPDHVA